MTSKLVQLCGATVPNPDGAGCVYLLPDSVRVPCPNYNVIAEYTSGSGWTLESCERHQAFCRSGQDDCSGRGWVPTEDAWVLFRSLWLSLHSLWPFERFRELGLLVWDGQAQFLESAVQMVQSIPGVEFGK